MSTAYTHLYELAPNLDVVANNSHSMYFPPIISTSSIIDTEYDYSTLDDNNINQEPFTIALCDQFTPDKKPKYAEDINPGLTDMFKKLIFDLDAHDLHLFMDYECISDEDVINLLILYSITDDNQENHHILHFMRQKGINPFQKYKPTSSALNSIVSVDVTSNQSNVKDMISFIKRW